MAAPRRLEPTRPPTELNAPPLTAPVAHESRDQSLVGGDEPADDAVVAGLHAPECGHDSIVPELLPTRPPARAELPPVTVTLTSAYEVLIVAPPRFEPTRPPTELNAADDTYCGLGRR